MELTNTNVRYLLTIYHLSQARLEVSSKDIAQTLDVSRASVTSMMSILTDTVSYTHLTLPTNSLV